MEFYIVDLTGRHYQFTNTTADTTIYDVKVFLAPSFNLADDVTPIHLIYQGQLCEHGEQKLSALGLSPGTQAQFKLHCVVKFPPPPPSSFFENEPVPMVINGISLGGTGETTTVATYEDFLQEFGFTANQINDLEQVDADIAVQIEEFEECEGLCLPTCLKTLLSRKGLPKYIFEKIAINPFVLVNFDEEHDAALVEAVTDAKVAFLFMMDCQGCCYWYAVWDHTKEEEFNDCEVYVLSGGEEFIPGSTALLTSKHFWQFFIDFHRQCPYHNSPI